VSQSSALRDFAVPPVMSTARDLQEAIRRRAEEIYIRNGSIPGHDLENWAEAEQEILREAERSTRRTAVVIEVDGVQYVGEYNAQSSDGYAPGEFGVGEPVLVWFEERKMVVKRPNGRRLATDVVTRIG
jgi:hypothetical protein